MQDFNDKTYTMEHVRRIAQKVDALQKELQTYVDSLDKEQIQIDLYERGQLYDNVRSSLRLSLSKIAELSTSPFGWFLTVQEGFYTAVDALIFYFDIQTNTAQKLIIIKRPDGTLAPIGGFTKYGEEPADCAIRESVEETGIEVAPHAVKLLGIYSAPDRDPRPAHIVSIAYIGVTLTWPEITSEAKEVFVYTKDEIEKTRPEDWFCKDHRQMALDAFKKFKSEYDDLLVSFIKEQK